MIRASTHYAEGCGFDYLVGIPDVPQAPIVAYVQLLDTGLDFCFTSS